MEDLISFIESIVAIKILIPIIVIIYFIVLLAKVWDNEKNTREIYNNQLEEIELLKRIANALENTEDEPYIIEKED